MYCTKRMKMMQSSGDEEMSSKRRKLDRISQLPEPILHHIMSFLPTLSKTTRSPSKTWNATTTRSLSKTWNATWNSFPVLEFDQIMFEKSMAIRNETFKSPKKRVHKFCDYVEKSITSRQSDVTIQKIQITIYIKGSRHAVPLQDIHRWLNYAKTNKVRHLSLRCLKDPPHKDEWRYVLPESLFCSESLEELNLFGCKFLEDGIRTTDIGFSLRTLSLHHVRVDQQSLQSFLSCCRSVEEIAIRCCEGFQIAKLSGTKLKKADLVITGRLYQVITIEAPNLQFLSYGGTWGSDIKSSILGSHCKNLRELMVHDTEITSDIFQIISLKFPLIEDLALVRCSLQETMEAISSTQVPSLSIHGGADFIKEIQAADLKLENVKKAANKAKIRFISEW